MEVVNIVAGHNRLSVRFRKVAQVTELPPYFLLELHDLAAVLDDRAHGLVAEPADLVHLFPKSVVSPRIR